MINNPSIPAGAAATVVSAARKRRWLLIANPSDTTIYLAFEGSSTVTAAGATQGFPIPSGGTFTWDGNQKTAVVFSQDIYAVHAAGAAKVLHIQEF